MLLPSPFLVRMSFACEFVPMNAKVIPESNRLLSPLAEREPFADLRLGWNDMGIALQLTVSGKENPPICNPETPRSSDGLSLWLDTRGDRTSHRASRFCHQFHFLPVPFFTQSKINRALQDAPIATADQIEMKSQLTKSGYRIDAFLPGNVLNGFDPDQYPKWGVYSVIRDSELGEQFLTINNDFPFSDDPSLWQELSLVTV